MSSFTVLLLCIQACLVQNVFSQCLGAYAPATIIAPAALSTAAPCGSGLGYGAGLAGLAYPTAGLAGAGLAGPFGLASGLGYDGLAYPGAAGYGSGVAAYGGAGEGNVAVAGELPVAGNTALYGQVPIMGAVSFSGPVAAAGSVSISGQCACGCNAPLTTPVYC
ncbi:chorion class A protein Ld12-like [Helicoverpa zea]|uniref:chorion class A protein Ld12-like n=1 Tax=Helicoverpa zea TaxID=7113 RepID=UPI001F56DA94|nr:chorion class A protein Ld12-like [Helicoverpa zea]